MSSSVSVFVNASEGLDSFAKTMSNLLELPLRPDIDGYGRPCYIHRDESLEITVGTHDLENDRDILFDLYRYQIDIRSFQRDEAAQEQYARSVFQKLKETTKYALMLVYDVQRKLDQYDPMSDVKLA